MTGLPNRRLIEQRLTSLLDPSERRAATHGVALLYCDLDGFKAVNDAHGHGVGDDVLCEAAARLTATARADDTVGRIGGDEFVVLMTTRLGEDARAVTAAVARRICSAFEAPFSGAQGVPVTVSIGIALPESSIGAFGLLRDADAAMYKAKKAGRNSFAFSTDLVPTSDDSTQ